MVNFIFGIMFICVVLPLIQDIMSIIANCTQYINAAITSKTRKDFNELFQECKEEEENESNPIGFATNAIGFETNDEEEYEDDDEEDE